MKKIFKLFRVSTMLESIIIIVLTIALFVIGLVYGSNEPSIDNPLLAALILPALPTAIRFFFGSKGNNGGILILPTWESVANYAFISFIFRIILFCAILLLLAVPLTMIRFVVSFIFIILQLKNQKNEKNNSLPE